MRSRWRYLDGWLILFMALAALASLIASHGSRVFFGYLVDAWLAWVFTAVLAIGIVGLDAAATLEPIWWKRWMYLAGMLLFLAMETLGNYFAGQAVFVARVRAALAGSPDSDLLTIATTSPGASRGLVVLFLALASVAVAFFTFAAATRAKQLAQPRRVSRRVRQLRGLARRLARALRNARADLAVARSLATETRAALGAADDTIASHRAEIAAAHEDSTEARAEIEKLRAENARLRTRPTEASPPPAPSRAAVVAYAQSALAQGRALADVARELGWSESSLRDWIKAASNGVHAP